MKNTRIYLAAMAVALLFVTSCKKETVNNLSFTARLETSSSDSKTTLDGTTLKWNYGSDLVRIYDANGSYDDFAAAAHPSHDNDRTCAELIPSENSQVELADPSNYTAIYPSSIASPTSSSVVTLPTVQASTSGELTGYPMYAQSDSKSLQFKNLCSVLKLSLTGGETISRIEVVTDKYINGTFTINPSTPSLELDNNATDHTKMTTLTLSSPVTLTSTASYFYIYLPVQEYKYIKINVYNESGLVYAKAANITNGVTLERSKYHLLTLSTPDEFEPSVLNGEFSVSPTQKVSFSKGNLILYNRTYTEETSTYTYTYFWRERTDTYTSATTTTEEYRFAYNQYERNGGTNPTYDKWLFAWARSNTASTMFERWNDSYTTTTTVTFLNLHTERCTNSYSGFLTGGGDINWRCLTQPEWDYLLTYSSQRMTYYDKNGNLLSNDINRCFTLATVNGVHGMIIFPDVFYWPLDEKEAVFTYSTWGGDNNTYDTEQWKILEGAGCVFLPTTGYKTDSDDHTNTVGQNNYGAYWSRTKRLDTPRFLLFSDQTSAFADDNSGDEIDNYNAIRLVKYLRSNITND